MRLAFHHTSTRVAALFIDRKPLGSMRDYLATRPGQSVDGILLGRAPADMPDPGPVVCSCFNVGLLSISRAVEAKGLMSVEEIGAALQAGTNCGSCRPELAQILAQIQTPAAAE